MNRYRTYGENDDVPELVGDFQFKRLDMRTDPVALEPGAVQRSENFRFDNGGARVRAGLARQFPPGTTAFEILFAGVYRPDQENDRLAFVSRLALVLFNPNDQTLTSYDFPAGETVEDTDAVDLVQGGVSAGTTPDLYICRGFAKDALKFDGSTVAVAAAFERASFALFYQDRMAAAVTRQAVKVSDFLDFTTWTQLNQFQILKGSDDYLVGFLAYQKDFVIIGTRKRFFIAFFDPETGSGGYTGSLKENTSFLRGLTQEGGPVGRRAMIEAGGLIWFITDNAIYAFQPRLDLELTVLGEPLSAPIQPIMDRLSANYASNACIERLGHRIYFALPINPEPVTIAAIDVETDSGTLTLPFVLPAVITASANLATVTTAGPHGLTQFDLVQLTGVLNPLLNGVFTVLGATDSTHFTIATDASPGAEVGTRALSQAIVRRNNRVAVFNLANNAWESVDTLPPGVYADYLRVADYGARRRLWLIDRALGPALFEQGDVDERSSATGGLRLPFYLPGLLSAANFESSPIPGRLTSRTLRWGPFAREVRAGEARITCVEGDTGSVNLTVRSPGHAEWTAEKDFSFVDREDVRVRKRCGKRGLEAELDITTASGRPAVRALAVEMTAAGRVAEE